MRLALLALVALLLAASPLRTARVEDEGDEALPPGMTEEVYKSLRSKLRKRAAAWWRYRKRLAMRCPQCKGAGKVPWRKGRRRVIVDCPKCDGHKLFVDKDEYRRCFYEMRSPTFRRQEGIQDRVTQEFVAAREGRPFPVILDRYKLARVEIVDATHGLVWVERNKESVARPQEWVWEDAHGEAATWYLWEAGADGAWPCADEPPAETPEPAPPEPAPPGAAPAHP